MECGERRVECGEWNVKCGMWREKSGEWRVECEMWNVECEEWNVRSGVGTSSWSVAPRSDLSADRQVGSTKFASQEKVRDGFYRLSAFGMRCGLAF